MPVLTDSSYPGPPFYEWNGHLQTILPAFTRTSVQVPYERERLELSDGDFIDLDWLEHRRRSLVILSHGLEGNAQRSYIQRAAQLFYQAGWDVLAWNCRSCSGEMNRKLRLYHHGEIDDFSELIQHALRTKDYENISLVGFSMGGSILMKYLGVRQQEAPAVIRSGIAFSSPCDLKGVVQELEKPENWYYKRRFLKSLGAKIRRKAEIFPDQISAEHLTKIKVWSDFDRYYTAPLSGFDDLETFYYQASAKNFMGNIQIPVLLVNAANDPILSPACYPFDLCEKHPYLQLEVPPQGGHVGFNWRRPVYTWMEHRALAFARANEKYH